MVNQGKPIKQQSRKTNVYLYISVLISHLEKKHPVDRETPSLSLPAFLSRSSDCCGRKKFLNGLNQMI